MKTKIILATVFLSACFIQVRAENLPDEQDLTNLQRKTSASWNRFEGRAFTALLDYYDGGFSSQETSQALYQLTVEYENILKNIHSEQISYKRLIEQYEGDDWDNRYGKNSLWRRFDSLTNQTSYLIAKCLYYRALCATSQQLQIITDDIMQKCAAISDGVNALYREILEAQVYLLLRRGNEGYFDEIFKRLDSVQRSMDSTTELYYEMWMCRLEMLKPFSKSQLNTVIKNFQTSPQAENALIAMRLAFLELQIGESRLLEKNLEKLPPVAEIIAKSRLSAAMAKLDEGKTTEYISSLTHFEKQLLAAASLDKKDRRFDTIISSFGIGSGNEDRVLSYVAAVKNVDYNPQIAFEAAIASLSKPAFTGNILSDITDLEVLSVAVKAGFPILKNNQFTEKVVDIFEQYKQLAGSEVNDAVIFAYAAEMLEIKKNRAMDILTELYEGQGEYADKALFELLVVRFNDGEEIKDDIAGLYDRRDETDKKFFTEVADLYSRQLATNGQADKALNILTDGYDKDCNFHSDCGLYVLEKFLEKTEFYTAENPVKPIIDAVKISGMIAHNQHQNANIKLVSIEIAVISGENTEKIGEFPDFEDKYNSMLFSRSKARYLHAKGEYFEAAFIWGRIANSLIAIENPPIWRWQRAKYYQLECGKASDKVSDEDILHSIGVLQVNPNWVDGYWAQKLEELKQQVMPIAIQSNPEIND